MIDLTGTPPKKAKVKQERNVIITEKLGGVLAKARRNNVGLSKLCELCDQTFWDMFPEYCGYCAMYGKCTKVGCTFKHDMVPDAVATQIVTKLKKVIDDPTLITGTSQNA